PSKEEVEKTTWAEYEGNILALRTEDAEWTPGFEADVKARDTAIRVVAKKVSGGNIGLGLRWGRRGGYYAWFNGKSFGVMKFLHEGGKWETPELKVGTSSVPLRDYFTFTFTARGDVLTVEANGEEVIRVRDSTHTEAGEMSFKTHRCTGLFKEAEVKVL